MKECANKVYGMRRVGGRSRNGSEWLCEEGRAAVAEKRRAFKEWLQMKDEDLYDRYSAQRAVVKQAVRSRIR